MIVFFEFHNVYTNINGEIDNKSVNTKIAKLKYLKIIAENLGVISKVLADKEHFRLGRMVACFTRLIFE